MTFRTLPVCLFLLASVPAHAELGPALVELILKPAPRLALSMSADGRALTEALLGKGALLRTTDPAMLRAQAEAMAHELDRPVRGASGEELYLRLLRLDLRAREAAGGRPLMRGEREIDGELLVKVQAFAAEELSLRARTFWEKFRGFEADLSGPIEFAAPTTGAAAYSTASEAFLAGATGASATPLERAADLLRAQARKADLAYLLVVTPQGRALRRLAGNPGYGPQDPAQTLIEALLEDAAKQDLVLQLALRLEMADQAVARALASTPSAPKSLRHRLMDVAAARYLTLTPESFDAGARAFTFQD